ncbi:MAG: hypothetical protein K9N51_09260 [Candidatus Pacebacteria bacterium]|nr:hypothetical protein [Candidatus Paceibacterota bacterium]
MSSDSKGSNTASAKRENVEDTIKSFESILEMFPEDVSALESLVVAYQEAGDLHNAHDKALTLADLMAQQGNWRRVVQLTSEVLGEAPENVRAQALHENADHILSQKDEETVATEAATPAAEPEPSDLAFDLNGELDLAWFLLEHDAITQEQYDSAISSLSNHGTGEQTSVSVSLLQELASMERVRIDKIIGMLSSEWNIPYLDITKFEIPQEVAQLLPLDVARKIGVLPFAMFGKELMVAVLNPMNKGLHKHVEAHLNRKIHIYLSSPEELQSAIDQLAGKKKTNAAG